MPRITGANHVTVKLSRLSAEMVEPVGQALFVAADEIKAEAQHSITEGSASEKGHVASLPGQPPNEDTGHLRANIESARTGPLEATVTSNARYSAPLEYGSSKMAARPFMGPAARKKKERVKQIVSATVKAVLKSK